MIQNTRKFSNTKPAIYYIGYGRKRGYKKIEDTQQNSCLMSIFCYYCCGRMKFSKKFVLPKASDPEGDGVA